MMPRQRVDPLHRQRVTQACDNCKRRKEKCNGALPCEQCKSRRRTGCCYTKHNQQRLSPGRGIANEYDDGEVRVALAAPEDVVPSLADTQQQADNSFASSSPNLPISKMLSDSKGKSIYIGESASLSFLQTVQSAVTVAVGPCSFTNGPMTNLMIENTTDLRFETAREISLDLTVVLSLAEEFFVATSGTLDLFDPPWLINEVSVWMKHPSQRSEPKTAVLYLALAIGAQGRARDEFDGLIAEQCFAYGRKLATCTLMDDPSLSTVQAFVLVTYYMIAACRRNAAFTNLGVAVRAAYTLGIHLHETNTSLAPEEGICRERAWKSLRVCDLFLSASLGRPPATSEALCNLPWASFDSTASWERPNVNSQISSAIFTLCNIIEQILVEVYSKKAAALELAKNISSKHRQWADALPRTLKIDGLEELNDADDSRISRRHGFRIVTMAYYYSIVLLTKPFLTFLVRSSRRNLQHQADSTAEADLITYADACVTSAIKGIDIAYEDVFDQGVPRRQPLVINSVFISTLCLGLAYLGDYDQQRWPLGVSLERGVTILSHLGQVSFQSARYAEICRSLKEAAAIYTSKRDERLLQPRSESVRNAFGNIQAPLGSQVTTQERPSAVVTPLLPGSGLACGITIPESVSPSSFDSGPLQQESIIPRSGILFGHLNPTHEPRSQYREDCDAAMLTAQCIATNAPDFFYGFDFGQDVPLSAPTNDVEPSMNF